MSVGLAKVFRHIFGAAAAIGGVEASVLDAELLQELCITIRSFRAREVLRKSAELVEAAGCNAARVAASALLLAL